MCGIFGFSGFEKATKKLLTGLSALEYRGYDSAGISVFCGGKIVTVKSKGHLSHLKEKLKDFPEVKSATCGIGHTRWATHGAPSDINSHPHGTDNLMLVHNGIIENFHELKAFLKEKGYSFESETDTEVSAKLIDYFYTIYKDPIDAIKKACEKFSGSYAIGVIFKDFEDKIYAVRRESPLFVCPSGKGNFITSDISAVLKYTKEFIRLGEKEVAVLESTDIHIFDFSKNELSPLTETAEWDAESAEKGGFSHFMLKEIFEEPDALHRTTSKLVKDNLPFFEDRKLLEKLESLKNIHIVACGTAMHAGLIGKYAIERLAKIPASVHIASEFRYNEPLLSKDDLVILISQSGETADTLAALRLAKEKGVFTLGIVNVLGSSVSQEADSVLFTNAGPEISVASTKAYAVQAAVLYLLSIFLGFIKNQLSEKGAKAFTEELVHKIPEAVKLALELDSICSEVALKYKDAKSIFFIGRGLDYYLCREAALKLKEISYIHCEAYAAGEMKHGTISLIDDGVPVFAFATQKDLIDKTISNIKEVKSRGAKCVLIIPENLSVPEDIADDLIKIPEVSDIFSPFISCVVAQLIAYHTANHLGHNVDKPRNLAKSVTVE